MKNRKGFTLVELLAVIAILAILVIIAMPNVLKRFNAAKKSTFETEVRRLIEEAGSEYVEDMMFSTSTKLYDSKSNPLDMSGNELDYSLYMDTKGNITCLQVNNGSYQFTYTGDGITKSSEINVIDKEEGFTPKCEKEEITNMFYDNKICFIKSHKKLDENGECEMDYDNIEFLDILGDSKTMKELGLYYYDHASEIDGFTTIEGWEETKYVEIDEDKLSIGSYHAALDIGNDNSFAKLFLTKIEITSDNKIKFKASGITNIDSNKSNINNDSVINSSKMGCYINYQS